MSSFTKLLKFSKAFIEYSGPFIIFVTDPLHKRYVNNEITTDYIFIIRIDYKVKRTIDINWEMEERIFSNSGK